MSVRPVAVQRYAGPLSGPLIDDPAPLEVVLSEVKLDSMTISRAIDALRRQSGVNIFVNWRRLADANPGFGPDTPVVMELRLKDVTLGQTLARLRDCIKSRDGVQGVAFGFGVEDGIVTISDRWSDGHHTTFGRWYYVQDLLNDPGHAGWSRPVAGDAAKAVGTGIFINTPRVIRPDVQDAPVQIIMDSVDMESWRANGGPDGTIYLWAGRLIIHQTPENHRKIESFLDNLRRGP